MEKIIVWKTFQVLSVFISTHSMFEWKYFQMHINLVFDVQYLNRTFKKLIYLDKIWIII